MRKKAAAGVCILAALALLVASGCNQTPTGPSEPGSPAPPAAGAAIVYAAVGASDAAGVGASVPCPLADCPNGTGYVANIARELRSTGSAVTLRNLGIPGAVISPGMQAIASSNGEIALNFIDAEMPFVPRDATVVTVFAGANDVRTIMTALARGAGGSDPNAYIDARIQDFRSDYQTLLNGIRSRAPNAWIVVANLPNFAGLPYTDGYSTASKRDAHRISVGFTLAINALVAQSVPVVDLACDSRSYVAGMYSSDGFHPNDTGYSFIASKYLEAIRSANHPAPASTCAQMSLVPTS